MEPSLVLSAPASSAAGPLRDGAASSAVPAAATAPPAVRPAELVRALAGWTALGLVGLAAAPSGQAEGVLLTLAPPVGALLLTVPALLVGHQYLALRASPAALVTTLVRGFVGSGEVALGLAPLALLFAATSSLGPLVVLAGVLGAPLQGLVVAMKRLQALEAGVEPDDWGARGRMSLLVLTWASLYGLIGLRLSWNLLVHLFA